METLAIARVQTRAETLGTKYGYGFVVWAKGSLNLGVQHGFKPVNPVHGFYPLTPLVGMFLLQIFSN
jgi:hypothetical protein